MLAIATKFVLALLVIFVNAVLNVDAVVVAVVCNDCNDCSISASLDVSISIKSSTFIFSPFSPLPNFSLNHFTIPQSPTFSSSHPLMSSTGFQSPNRSAAFIKNPPTAPAALPTAPPAPNNAFFTVPLKSNPLNFSLTHFFISPIGSQSPNKSVTDNKALPIAPIGLDESPPSNTFFIVPLRSNPLNLLDTHDLMSSIDGSLIMSSGFIGELPLSCALLVLPPLPNSFSLIH